MSISLISIICVSTLCIFICLYIIYNLYSKNKIYENWAIFTIEKIENLQENIKQIDERGIFEKDDEVGGAFNEISDIIKQFDHGGKIK